MSSNKYNYILKKGLKLPSELGIIRKIKNKFLDLKNTQREKNINKSLLSKINQIYDEVKPKEIPFSRSNAIYGYIIPKHIFNPKNYER